MKRRRLLVVIGVFVAVVLVGGLGFVVWANDTNPVMDEALAALVSDETVSVTQDDWIVFQPVGESPQTGVIFYPGGKVDARAYAPTMHDLAAEGYLAVIVPMPLNLAVFGINRADAVIAAFPQIDRWVMAGHSLGSVMAASYTAGHLDQVGGLVLYAGYPLDRSLADSSLPVLAVYGTRDGRVEELEAALDRLPAGAVVVPIEGGNHAQFGYYGIQAGDGEAEISRADQQAQITAATLDFLE